MGVGSMSKSIENELSDINRFSGGIAHDLNNILMIIDGFSSCLRKTLQPDQVQNNYINQIDNASKKAGELTDILDLLSGHLILNKCSLDLEVFLSEFITNKLSREKNRHLFELNNSIDNTHIHMDKQRFLTVIENLYQNSIYPDEESRKISYTINRIDTEGNDREIPLSAGKYITLDIEDNGPGIGENIRQNIYKPYFSSKPKGKGKGLGLAISAEILSQCEAFMVHIPDKLPGCLFRIYFADHSVNADKKTILLIEKNEIIREIMKESLVINGFTVYTALDAVEGDSVINSYPIDLLISDLSHSESEEYKPFLNKINSRNNLKIISFSDFTSYSNKIKCFKNHKFLQKPIKPSELINAAKEILNMEGN